MGDIRDQKLDPAKMKYKLFTVGAVGTFMATFDGSIQGVALPTIARDLDAPIELVVWVALAYSLTLVSLMLVFGAWAGIKGYSFAYKFGYLFFLAGSVICSFSPSIEVLILGRVVQALGTAMFQAVGPGMITEVFPDKERGKGIGLMVMMVSAGLMFGAPVGGFLLSIWPWQSIFIINIPIGILGLYLTHHYFKRIELQRRKRDIHLGGAFSISIAILTGMLMLSFIADYQLSDIRIWGLALISLIALAVFVRFEANTKTALIGLEVFKNRQFTTSIIAAQTLFVAMSGVMLLLPFYLENIRGLLPKNVGFYLVILPISMFVAAPLAGKLSDRIGFRVLTTSGILSLAIGLAMLSRLDTATSYSFIIVSLIFIGLGVGTFNTPNSSAMMGSVGPEQRSTVSGIVGTSRNLGFAIGVALSTSLFTWFKLSYDSIGDENLIFIASFEKVILFSVVVALLGVPFCVVRENRAKH